MKAYFKKKKKRVSSFESNEVARLGRGDPTSEKWLINYCCECFLRILEWEVVDSFSPSPGE